jgi:RND family efflux transporter MFP subunit
MSIRRILILSFCLTLALVSLRCSDEAEGQNGIADESFDSATDVKVITVMPQSFDDYIEVTGKVKADIASTVSSEEQGVLQAFLKDKGSKVRKNQVVVVLDSESLQAQFDEAEANYLLSKATFERQKNLYEDKVISEQKYLEHKFSLDRDKARYDNLKAHLDNTEIRTPVSGHIDQKFAEVGELVMPGTPLFSVVKTDIVKIEAGVPESYVRNIQLGSKSTITFDVLPGTEFEAPVTFVGPSISNLSRTFPIEIELKNDTEMLKPEMFANIRIQKAHLEDVVVIPRDAIIETETGKYAFVVNDGAAKRRAVKIGAAFNNMVWIEEGIVAGEQLIVVGHRDLVDGEQVAIRQ